LCQGCVWFARKYIPKYNFLKIYIYIYIYGVMVTWLGLMVWYIPTIHWWQWWSGVNCDKEMIVTRQQDIYNSSNNDGEGETGGCCDNGNN